MRKLILILFIYSSNYSIIAQEHRGFLNPGIKLCYTFGKDWSSGEATLGVEISYMISPKDNGLYLGAAVGVDLLGKNEIINLSIQASLYGIGCMVGPSFIIGKDVKPSLGYHTNIFLGILFIPFYSFIDFGSDLYFKQGGFFLKLPIMVDGKKFSFQ